jgi:glycosyltransferase involved in cell wall biosynthesis
MRSAARAEPTVSVIVSAFQAEHVLAQAIDSVLAQTYGDYEILIADDGSTDGTRKVAAAYEVTYPERVRLLRHPDHRAHGVGATRRLALGRARGEYIAFLDADEVWSPAKLAQQAAILDAHPEIDLVSGGAMVRAARIRTTGPD